MILQTPISVALALASAEEEDLWRGILDSQGIAAIPLSPAAGRAAAFATDSRLASCVALVADAPALLAHGLAPAPFARSLRQGFPRLKLLVRLPSRPGISAGEREWARSAGIASLLPGGTVAAWQDSIAPVLERILENVGRPKVNTIALGSYLNGLLKSGAEPRSGVMKDLFADALRLKNNDVNALRILDAMQQQGAVGVADRSYRGKKFRQCFVAAEAIDWMQLKFGLRRSLAAAVGSFLWRTGHIHHVVREAPFTDDYLFFRFGGRRSEFDGVDLTAVDEAMRGPGGLDIADRSYRGKVYPRCFLGAQAVAWLMQRYGLSLGAAEVVGQRLLELGVLHHVVDAHDFLDEDYFYRFRADEVAAALA